MSLLLGRNQFGSLDNTGNVLTRKEANALLNEWVLNNKLKLHMSQVAGLMAAWAHEKLNLSEDQSWKWEMAGLLHDADWDQ